MKKFTLILAAIIGGNCFLNFDSAGQSITTPSGTPLTIQSNVEALGDVNLPATNTYKIGGTTMLSAAGTSNVFVGQYTGGDKVGAAVNPNTGIRNLFLGSFSGYVNTTGLNNAFIGYSSGAVNTTGKQNLFLGSFAGTNNTIADNNAFIGFNAGRDNTIGIENLFLGASAGLLNVSGNNNVSIGVNAGNKNTASNENSNIGSYAGFYTTGEKNTFIGAFTGYDNTTGTKNTFVGHYAGSGGMSGLTNATAIGANATTTLSNTVVLGNNATTITGAGLGADKSGLKFPNLTRNSPATPGPTGTNGKVLSVDNDGNVILVQITGAGVSTQSVGEPVADGVTKKVDDLAKQVDAMKSVKTTWVEKDGDGFLRNVSPNGVVIEGKGFEGQALIVKGKMLSEEVNVKLQDSDWPDYVFQPNYKRMTLGEVEKFISINGHLPNVPSATEMAKTGNNLGKTDVKLLEKVEELTLYLLDMKKANDAQAAELKALKQQVSKLRKK
jgi:trimeric autotransporter adhesin